jgi:DNA-binding transcriptional ArsR family regulator
VSTDLSLKAIANERRRAILRLIGDGPRSASELAARVRLSPQAASQHLNALRVAGLVSVQAEGNRRMYSANFDALQALRSELDALWGDRLAALKAGVEAEQAEGVRREAG